MCLVLLIAAACPLPAAPIDPEHRRIAVIDLRTPEAAHLARWMTLPYAYDVTSRYGCACALQTSPEDAGRLLRGEGTDEELQSIRETLEDLQRVADLVAIGLAAGLVELFTYWEADRQQVEIESRRTVTLAELRTPGFGLVERQMLTVVADRR